MNNIITSFNQYIRIIPCKIKLLKSSYVLGFILCCSTLNGQTDLDSLLQIWTDKSAHDSIKADAYLEYIYDRYLLQEPDSAVHYFQVLWDFSTTRKLTENRIYLKKHEGYHYFRTGQYEKAITAYNTGLKIAEQSKHIIGQAEILLRKGWLYHDNGQKLKAIDNYKRSLSYFEMANDSSGMASVYNELGSIYSAEEDFEKSMNYFEKSLQVSAASNDETVFTNIGNLYIAMGEYDKSLEYLFKSLDIGKQAAIKDHLATSTVIYLIGVAYRELGEQDKALTFFHRGIKLSTEINDVQGMISFLLEFADLDLEKGNYQAAISKCRKSLTLAQSLDDLDEQQASYECLYEAYKAIENPTKALSYHEKMLVFMDSLKGRETTAKLMQMEFSTQFKTDSLLQLEKELKVEIKHQEELRIKEKNRNIAIAGSLFFLLIAIGSFIQSRIINKSRRLLQIEKNRSESLLLNILPAEIAEELKATGKAEAKDFQEVSILFTDFKNFTKFAASTSPQILVQEINECFEAFDFICEKYNIEKIKTIGDAYMAAGGLSENSALATKNTVLAGLEMQDFIKERLTVKKGHIPFEMRLGIHTGPITAGIVGVKKFQYDVWGDTVNTASRMESAGQIHKVNISKKTYSYLKQDAHFSFENRGDIAVKGKGDMKMYFVELVTTKE